MIEKATKDPLIPSIIKESMGEEVTKEYLITLVLKAPLTVEVSFTDEQIEVPLDTLELTAIETVIEDETIYTSLRIEGIEKYNPTKGIHEPLKIEEVKK